jgi:hypothetical protein
MNINSKAEKMNFKTTEDDGCWPVMYSGGFVSDCTAADKHFSGGIDFLELITVSFWLADRISRAPRKTRKIAETKDRQRRRNCYIVRGMKKRLVLVVTVMGLAWLAVSGCSNKNIDTAKVRAAFQSLSGDARQYLDTGLKAIDESNYVAAVRPLKTLAYKVKLDKDQRDILEDTIAKAEAKAAKQK